MPVIRNDAECELTGSDLEAMRGALMDLLIEMWRGTAGDRAAAMTEFDWLSGAP